MTAQMRDGNTMLTFMMIGIQLAVFALWAFGVTLSLHFGTRWAGLRRAQLGRAFLVTGIFFATGIVVRVLLYVWVPRVPLTKAAAQAFAISGLIFFFAIQWLPAIIA